MCPEPTNVARAADSVSAPHAPRSGRPRIAYSSSEPCALTANCAPDAAPTGPPSSTWFVKTRSAGSSARTAAAFASTHCSSCGPYCSENLSASDGASRMNFAVSR